MGDRAFSEHFPRNLVLIRVSYKLCEPHLLFFRPGSKDYFFHVLVLMSNYTYYTFPNMTPTLFLTYFQYYTKLSSVTFNLP